MNRQVIFRVSLLAAGLLALAWPCLAQAGGNPQRGEALYVGTAGFANGGAPCLACHGIAGHDLGQASGASYGPDLTGLYGNYGEDGVAGVLEDLSFTSMEAIYAARPLTDDERADLLAFFASVADAEPRGVGAGLVLHALAALLAFLLLVGALGWRRLRGVRKPLVEKVRYGKGERV